jgi:hypothetical protein
MTSISNLEAHGIPVTAHGGPLETTVPVYDADQLRSLLDLGLDEAGREAHYQALFGGVAPATSDAVSKITAHAVGNGTLSEADKAAAAPTFPITAHVTANAVGPITVNARYDLSTPDGSPRIVSFTDVVIDQGGYFVCEGTPLAFTCDTLTRNGNSGSTNIADFNILGRTPATPATPPTPAGATQASSGYGGECSSAGIAGHGGGPGNPGATGTPGTPGSPGLRGVASMPATITIQSALNSNISVFSQSGPGGQGGSGGQGGPGQQGGNGGGGVTCGCTGNAGGQGGDGGAGGVGGNGGNGGDAADAAGNVVIRVPSGQTSKVASTTAPAPPGAPGTPGPGGVPGAGGDGGGGGKDNNGGSKGGTATYGASGQQGTPGTITGRAAQIQVLVAPPAAPAA